MKSVLLVLVLVILESTLVEVTFAQGVPAAVAILPTQTKTSSQATGEVDDSDRYEKRTSNKPHRRTIENNERPELKYQQPTAPNAEVSRPLDQATTLTNMAPSQKQEEDRGTVGENMRDMIVGGSSDDVDRYRSYLSPDDIRRNRVELEIAPLFIYNDSKSDYYYRNYNAATPGGRIGVNVWFTPFFGVSTSYEKTFLGTMRKDINGSSQTPFMDQWLQIGLRFRRYTSYSSLSPSLTFGVDYHEYQKKVPLDDLRHTKLATTGLLLSVQSQMPSSESLSWVMGLEYMPIANHEEVSTAGNIKSGQKVETFKMGISFGPEIKLNRTNRLFFKIREVYEKNSFTGTANTTDPHTGETPENVSVTNNFLFFEVGYIWGN